MPKLIKYIFCTIIYDNPVSMVSPIFLSKHFLLYEVTILKFSYFSENFKINKCLHNFSKILMYIMVVSPPPLPPKNVVVILLIWGLCFKSHAQ